MPRRAEATAHILPQSGVAVRLPELARSVPADAVDWQAVCAIFREEIDHQAARLSSAEARAEQWRTCAENLARALLSFSAHEAHSGSKTIEEANRAAVEMAPGEAWGTIELRRQAAALAEYFTLVELTTGETISALHVEAI